MVNLHTLKLTWPRDRILPIFSWTHPNAGGQEWTNHVSSSQSYPWWQPQTGWWSVKDKGNKCVCSTMFVWVWLWHCTRWLERFTTWRACPVEIIYVRLLSLITFVLIKYWRKWLSLWLMSFLLSIAVVAVFHF